MEAYYGQCKEVTKNTCLHTVCVVSSVQNPNYNDHTMFLVKIFVQVALTSMASSRSM